jgi:hypothetical protein
MQSSIIMTWVTVVRNGNDPSCLPVLTRTYKYNGCTDVNLLSSWSMKDRGRKGGFEWLGFRVPLCF